MIVTRSTPATLLDSQASAFRTQLSCVFDGEADAVHAARVATRRIRELLRVFQASPEDFRESADIAGAFAQIGRALGRVRDVDVRIALVKALETHTPQAAPSLVLVRHHFEGVRLKRMRRLIKMLERLGIDELIRVVSDRHRAGVRTRLASGRWRARVRDVVVERACTAIERIKHATGVYFPNRAHSARIAIKRLRYTAEILEATSARHIHPSIKILSKAQRILGDLHDRQELADWLGRHATQDGVDADHIKVTRQVLEADIHEMHKEYLAQRESVRAASADVQRVASTATGLGPALALATTAAVTGVVWTWALAGDEVTNAIQRSLEPRRDIDQLFPGATGFVTSAVDLGPGAA